MSTIDQNTPNGNPTDEPNAETSQTPITSAPTATSAEAPERPATTEDQRIHEAARSSTPTSATNTATMYAPGSPKEVTAESAPDSEINAPIAELRARLKGHVDDAEFEPLLSRFERTVRRQIAAENHDDVSPPASTSRPTHAHDDEREPPTSHTALQPTSRLAIRQDGVFLISLEDADTRDLEGREIIRFMSLSPDEAERARATTDGALANAAASIIGRLPKKPA